MSKHLTPLELKRKKARIHEWVRKHFEKPNKCEICGLLKEDMEWSNKDHKYKLKREYWQYLCRGCHSKYDFANKLRKGHKQPLSKIAKLIIKYTKNGSK